MNLLDDLFLLVEADKLSNKDYWRTLGAGPSYHSANEISHGYRAGDDSNLKTFTLEILELWIAENPELMKYGALLEAIELSLRDLSRNDSVKVIDYNYTLF